MGLFHHHYLAKEESNKDKNRHTKQYSYRVNVFLFAGEEILQHIHKVELIDGDQLLLLGILG